MSANNAADKLKNFQVDVKQEEREAAKDNVRTLKRALWCMLTAFVWWVSHFTEGLGWVIQLSGWKDEALLAGNLINLCLFGGAFCFAMHSAKQVKTGG